MKRSTRGRSLIVATFMVGMALCVAALTMPVYAQMKGPATGTVASANLAVDNLQRAIQIDKYHLVADSGEARGETLYFYKCWMCHNQYTVQAQYGDKAPFLRLKDLFSRQK